MGSPGNVPEWCAAVLEKSSIDNSDSGVACFLVFTIVAGAAAGMSHPFPFLFADAWRLVHCGATIGTEKS